MKLVAAAKILPGIAEVLQPLNTPFTWGCVVVALVGLLMVLVSPPKEDE
jgi:uncharacterized membrane protein